MGSFLKVVGAVSLVLVGGGLMLASVGFSGFDSFFALLFLLGFVAFLGWALGIAGFLQARQLGRELAALRVLVTSGVGFRAAAPVADPFAAPAVAEAATPVEPPPLPVSSGDAEPLWTPAAGPTVPKLPPLPQRKPLDEVLAMRWGVWAGAGALLLAAVFLVNTGIEEGWFDTSPAVRCALAVLLGLLLAGGAEALRRYAARTPTGTPDWTPGALAAGSAASLFGAAYATGPLYALVPGLVGFVLMAGAAAAGLLLSLRFGPLAAAVGVAGAYATPALVQSDDPSLPGLFGYLLAVTAAAMAVVRQTAWGWLGWAATVAGAGWVVLVAFGTAMAHTPEGSPPALPDIWAPALFVPACAALHLLLLPRQALDTALGRRLSWVPLLALGTAGLLLGQVTDTAWSRAGVLLLLAVAVGKGRTEPRLDRLPWLAAALGTVALFLWVPSPPKLPTEPQVLTPALPAAIQAFVALAAAWGVLGFGAGALFERRAPHGLRWVALAASVPVLALAAAWWRLGEAVLNGPGWAAAALALAGLHTFMAGRAARAGEQRIAGAYAAGAAAAICLAFTVLLREWWLTGAVSLLLPALAFIEQRSGLRPLRAIAAVLALVVLGRLLLNPSLAFYTLGAAPVLNGLLPAYALPAASFAVSALLFARTAEDGLPNLLRAGACALATALVATEIRHLAGGGDLKAWKAEPGELGFQEAALHATAFWTLAVLTQALALRKAAAQAAQSLVLAVTWRVQAAMGLAAGIMLVLGNPAVGGADVGTGALLNDLLPAYALPAVLAGVLALRWPRAEGTGKRFRTAVAGYAAVSAFAWATLLVRHLFHPGAMALWDEASTQAELWTYSGVWLLCAALLMGAGLRRGAPQALRLASLGLVALTALKAVFVDLAGLGGLWRALSFLALGLTLILLGAAYRRFGTAPPRDADAAGELAGSGGRAD